MGKRVLGIDQAREFGWAIGCPDFGRLASGCESLPKIQNQEGITFNAARKHLKHLCERYIVTDIFFEQTFLPTAFTGGRRNDQFASRYQQLGLTAIIQATADELQIPAKQVLIIDWRKRFIGKTKSPPHIKGEMSRQWWKDQSVSMANQRGWDVTDDNEADALGIMDYGLCVVSSKWKSLTDGDARRREDRLV